MDNIPIKSRNNFGDLLRSLSLSGNGIEVGAGEGNFSEILRKNTDLKKIYLLDIWDSEFDKKTEAPPQVAQDKTYELVVKKFGAYSNRIEVIRGDSRKEMSRFSDNFFDFIYIDANHEYEFVRSDLNNWYPKLKIGGVFSGHDYLDGFFPKNGRYGVKSAVDEFCKNIQKNVMTTGGTRRCPRSWYFIR